jgi:hypothetical protein
VGVVVVEEVGLWDEVRVIFLTRYCRCCARTASDGSWSDEEEEDGDPGG